MSVTASLQLLFLNSLQTSGFVLRFKTYGLGAQFIAKGSDALTGATNPDFADTARTPTAHPLDEKDFDFA